MELVFAECVCNQLRANCLIMFIVMVLALFLRFTRAFILPLDKMHHETHLNWKKIRFAKKTIKHLISWRNRIEFFSVFTLRRSTRRHCLQNVTKTNESRFDFDGPSKKRYNFGDKLCPFCRASPRFQSSLCNRSGGLSWILPVIRWYK